MKRITMRRGNLVVSVLVPRKMIGRYGDTIKRMLVDALNRKPTT